ncbi:MAG: FKBP-type peptidyl-prolyl cis-trans isomerase [Bacteroidota bacterium]
MRSFVICICLGLVGPAFSQSKKELQAEVNKLKAEIEQLKKPKEADLGDAHKKACYGIGMIIGSNIKMQSLDSMNVEAIVAGLNDVLLNKTTKFDRAEADRVVQDYMMRAMEIKSKKAKDEGQAFLEKNKAVEGVKTTSSGLQYKVVMAGTGKSPVASNQVTVHYTGKLIDGTVFDSSVERGQPATFGVGEVISGWTEGLQLMKEGDKWIFYIPYELAYGERGAPPQIPPYSTLVFEVELIKVN